MRRYPIIVLVMVIPFLLHSNNYIEVTIGAGYTAIDLDSLVEKDENEGSSLTDWDQFSYGVSGQYYFYSLGSIQLGAELMFLHMYWYSVKVPYGSQPIYRDYSVNRFSIAPIVRFNIGKHSSIDLGPVAQFSDSLDMGFFASFNYFLDIFNTVEIPIKLRVDIRDGLVTSVPLTLSTGIQYKL